jgi:hypothetical protein
MQIHWHQNIALGLAAVTLNACGALQARSASFLIESQSASFDPTIPDPDINFRMTFNQAPDFFTVDGFGREENDFQYTTPDSIIRGPEIYITRNTVRIRSLGPPDSNPVSGGWGPVIATVAFKLIGDTLTFSAPFDLFNSSPIFTYQLQADTFGVDNDLIVGSSTAPASAIPEPSSWAMMLIGFAGLSYASYRVSRRAPRSSGKGTASRRPSWRRTSNSEANAALVNGPAISEVVLRNSSV